MSVSDVVVTCRIDGFVLRIPANCVTSEFKQGADNLINIIKVLKCCTTLLLIHSPLLLVNTFTLGNFTITYIDKSVRTVCVSDISRSRLMELGIIRQFIFCTSCTLSTYINNFVSSTNTCLVNLLTSVVTVILALIIIIYVPRVQEKSAATAPGHKVDPGVVNTTVTHGNVLHSTFVVSYSRTFTFITLRSFFSLLLTNHKVGTITSNIVVTIRLLTSTSVKLVIPDIVTRISGNHFTHVYNVIHLSLTTLFLVPFAPICLLPIFCMLRAITCSLFTPVGCSVFRGTISSSVRYSLVSIRDRVITINTVLFCLFGTTLDDVTNVQIMLLITLKVSSLICVPTLFHLADREP